MKKREDKKMKGYKIDFTTNTVTITKDFAK